MTTYALQTKTMLHNTTNPTPRPSILPTKGDLELKPKLPTKRKRESICGLGTFNKPFVIKPCPDSPYAKPSTFTPIRIIGRSQLPLTFLDTTSDDQFTPGRLFSAHIDILEQDRDGHDIASAVPKVLIARYETKRTLYAIERVQPRVYSLCKLAGWLKEKDVASLWDPASLTLYPSLPKVVTSGAVTTKWWEQAVVQTQPDENAAKRVRLSMFRPAVKPVEPPREVPVQEAGNIEKSMSNDAPKLDDTVPAEFSGMPIETPSPQQLLENLAHQYLDAVYLSKMSLAYFAKGPITRVRNAFTSSEEGAPPTHELVTSLRTMLLSHKASDKKYREKLPEVIKAILPGSFSDDELETAAKPKKSKKKMKLNRSGIYPQEELVIQKWWKSEMRMPEAYGEETMDQRIKRRIGDLRVRETLAQMIIMLEIVALEALSTYKEPTEEGEGETQEETQGQAESQAAKPKKRKKKLDDINLQLDLLLDKLCIWQSVDQEGILDFDSKNAKNEDPTEGPGKNENSDRLQSFCVEVIVPFYMRRLPEQARMINKKLGGPASSTPSKRKAMRPPMPSRKSGEPKEPDVKKSRRSLARVATDTTGQTGQRKPTPSLARSTTDSALLTDIKREGSEVPLSAIPFQRSPSQAARRSMSHFNHLKGRQVDLSAPSAAAAAKIQQKKRVEDEVKEAIAALKKPNRGLAVGGYVDDMERRGLGVATKSSRKPTNTVRKVVKDVQVSATPRVAKRTKNVIEQTPNNHRNPFVRERDFDAIPSSSLRIPSSGVRSMGSIVPGTVQRSTASRKQPVSGIAETPSKAPNNRSFSSGAIPGPVFATPVKHRAVSPPLPEKIASTPAAVLATPNKVSFAIPSGPSGFTPQPVFTTPTKEPPAAMAAATTIGESPLPSGPSKQQSKSITGTQPSIYDALGWNDDNDIDDMF
ncbi:hypothetical protein BU24DRAFT_418721 [Aaosphaeria arxii CBS 175.79]|uniref:DNA replication regulator Sld3 C-terminal domain-containing protein n=1 Tax=Aaosphaeria arxii CBS 175.79 TaxID=1450172 RepID=A0A6A5Y1I3_9PLEO|nr:uncharacterized protein BU24DRAFT_418721 [Aaosphaeria arxii CBS 175.79]KAF2019119.1 hypothetical protein BU24DRAFT_418721 [Aaosphaeria arxii CBS 175.79]